MRYPLAIAAIAAAAGQTLAQTPTLTIQLNDQTIIGTGEGVTIPTGLLGFSPIVAWRFTSDYSQLGDTFSPVPTGIRCLFNDPDGNPISDRVAAPNATGGGGADVEGLFFAGSFTEDPTSFSSVELFIDPRSQASFFGVFASPLIEFFSASSLPVARIDSQPLVGTAPTIDADLRFVAIEGDPVSFAADDQGGAWQSSALALYTGSGGLITFGPFRNFNVDQRTIKPDDVNTAPDGSFSFRPLGSGEYAVAAMSDWDDVLDNFGAEGDNNIAADAIVTINGKTATIPQATINTDPDLAGWIKFAIGARDADFNFDGLANAQDLLDYLPLLTRGFGDFDADGNADFGDLLALLTAIDAAS